MQRCGTLVWLGLAAWGMGAEPVAPAADGNARMAQLAEALLGKSGGNQLFYFPTHDVPATPKDWGFKFDEVRFKSKDGTALHGWFVPVQGKLAGKAKGTGGSPPGGGGWGGTIVGFNLGRVAAGYNGLTYDYRGFGKSDGKVDRRGMVDDVQAAFDYVVERADVDPGRLISLGHSLGGAKSLVAISERPVKGLRAVITDAAFASYQAMARRIGGEVGARLVTDELAPKDSVAKLAPLPLLIVHGTNDEVVPFAQGRQLFEAAHEPKTMFAVKGGHHGDSLLRNEGAYRKKLLEWLGDKLAQ